jgi:hypothetical protein
MPDPFLFTLDKTFGFAVEVVESSVSAILHPGCLIRLTS